MNKIVKDQQIVFGNFYQPFQDVNLLDARIYPFYTPKWFKKLRLKEFQAVQGGNDRFYFCIALFNAKLTALAQIRLYDKIAQKHYLIEQKVAPWKLKMANNLLDSENVFSNKNISIRFNNNLAKNRISVFFEGKDKAEHIKGNFTAFFNGVEHNVSSIPFTKNRGMYSHKGFAPMEGELVVNNKPFVFHKRNSFFALDDHKGYYPYKMKWDWLSTGFFRDGVFYGVNLTVNQSNNPEQFNENFLMINTKHYKLPMVGFKREGDTWYITSQDDTINLMFTVEHDKKVSINLGPLGGSNYEGPFGRVSGTIKTKELNLIIDNEFAFAEKQYIRC